MNNEEKILQMLTDMQSGLSSVKGDVSAIRVDVENRIDSQLKLLAEGQKTILETLAPKNRVESLEDEVAFLKQMIKVLAGEVNELKKAQ